MLYAIQSQDLRDILRKIYSKKMTGFVSVTTKEGLKHVYGTLQVLKGQLVAAEYANLTGGEAVKAISNLSTPSVSFARNMMANARHADVPSLVELLDTASTSAASAPDTGGGFGIRTKMLLLFTVLPSIILIGLSFFFVTQLQSMSTRLIDDGKSIVTDLAEESIHTKAVSVATESSRYLVDHPDLVKEAFNDDPVFSQIASQSIGTTGYSVLLDAPDGLTDPSDIVWYVHPNTQLVGLKLGSVAEALGDNWPGLKETLTPILTETSTEGYYAWQDPDGQIRDKYMALERVPGTSYIIAATTYIDEFTQPVTELQAESAETTRRTRLYVGSAISAAILFTIIVVSFYGNRLSRRIQSLSDVAERISLGKLDAAVDGVNKKDEIGTLARATERLRISVQMAFSELQKQQS